MSDYSSLTQEEKNEKFLDAIKLEDLKAAQELLDAGADINTRTLKGNNGLFLAVTRNKRKSFAWLLREGIDPNVQDTLGESIVMNLAQNDKLDYLKHLLSYKTVDLTLQNALGVTALHYACMYSNVDCALELIKNGAPINIKTIQDTTPILTAAQNHSLPIFKSLLENGAKIDDLDNYKKDILINIASTSPSALKKPEQEELEQLFSFALEQGANPSYVAPSGMTPIFAAMMFGQKKAVKALLDAGANPNVSHNIMTVDNITPLHLAFEMGDAETAGFILEKLATPEAQGDVINAKNSDGNTPGAFGFFHKTTRQLALDSHADVNAVLHVSGQSVPVVVLVINSADETAFDVMVSKSVKLNFTEPEFKNLQPIKLAIAIGLPGMVEKVIKNAGINLNDEFHVSDDKTITPLSFLCANSQAQMLASFLEQKKMIQSLLNQKLGDGSDAYRLPEETRQELQKELDKYKNIETELKQNKEVIFDLLISSGADINYQDKNGRTALFYVADEEYVDLLLNRGADFFKTDIEGNNPLSWAIKNGRVKLIDKFLQYVIDNDHIDKPEIQNILIDMVYTGPDADAYHAQKLFEGGLNHAVQEGSGLLDVQDADGNTALIVACATQQAPIAGILLGKGADINLANNNGETALMHAIAHGFEDLVQGLIEKGADVFAVTKEGKSVQDFADEVQNKEIISLVSKKIDPTLKHAQLSDKVRI